MNWLAETKIALNKERKNNNTSLPESTVVTADVSETRSTGDFYGEFAETLKDRGYHIDFVRESIDAPFRVDVGDCRPGSKPGWYFFRVIGNSAFGSFGDWRLDSCHTWSSCGDSSNETEIIKAREEFERQKKIADEERERLAKAAIIFVRSKFASFTRVGINEYINRKQIRAGANLSDAKGFGKSDHTDLVIPLYNINGEIDNWQIITQAGVKRFKKYAPKKGRFNIVGDLHNSHAVCYCEGYATGCSIVMATGMAVIICFDAGNILPVMHETRELVAGKQIFIGADNDKNKTGIKKAEEAHKEYQEASIVIPWIVGYDFNDLMVNGGRAEPTKVQVDQGKVMNDGMQAVLELFQKAGYEKPAKQEIKIWKEEDVIENRIPKELREFPTQKMNELMAVIDTFGIKISRQISMMGAITFACGLAGRNYMEGKLKNFSSIMGAIIAPTGSGKNYPKRFIDAILTKSEKLSDYNGSSSYTSEAAIRNQLMQHPVKISVIDEFGDKLSRGVKGVGSRDSESFDAFKEIYSDAGGVWKGRAYASSDPSGGKHDIRSENIYNPSLTILGLSTPAQFVDAISSAHIEGGFLNRFIIVDARLDATIKFRNLDQAIPAWLLGHVEKIVEIKNRKGNVGAISGHSYSEKPNPYIINMTQEVDDLFWDFSNYIDENYVGDTLMENVSVRWVENAIRMSVGIAAFENPTNPQITQDIANWCISFVQYHGKRLATLINTYSHINGYDKLRSQCLAVIRKQGDEGLSKSQMAIVSPFRGLDLKTRNKILTELREMGFIDTNIIKGKKYGNKVVYYALMADEIS